MPIRFTLPANLRVGAKPRWLAIGDFNSDGHPDLATANGKSVSVLLAAGTSRFGPPHVYPVPGRPASITAGDLNGDARADLAVANYTGDAVWVMLARPDGSFRTSGYPADDGPYTVAITDLNLDDHPDLVAANYDASTVSSLLGRGDGTFRSPINRGGADPVFPAFLYIAAGDVDGDGRPDVAAADESNDVWIMRGHGDGTFGKVTRYSAGTYFPFDAPAGVAIADLNLDERLDLAVTQLNARYVSVLLGRGDGTFTRVRNYRLAPRDSSNGPPAVADLNRDGRLDIAASTGLAVSLALGRGDGSFRRPAHYRLRPAPAAAAVADLNGDSLLDVAVANGRNVSVLFQTTATPPRIAIRPVTRGCLPKVRRVRIEVTSETPPTSVSVFVDGRRIKRTAGPRLTIQLRAAKLRPGRHSLRVTAANRAHLAATEVIKFGRCRSYSSTS